VRVVEIPRLCPIAQRWRRASTIVISARQPHERKLATGFAVLFFPDEVALWLFSTPIARDDRVPHRAMYPAVAETRGLLLARLALGELRIPRRCRRGAGLGGGGSARACERWGALESWKRPSRLRVARDPCIASASLAGCRLANLHCHPIAELILPVLCSRPRPHRRPTHTWPCAIASPRRQSPARHPALNRIGGARVHPAGGFRDAAGYEVVGDPPLLDLEVSPRGSKSISRDRRAPSTRLRAAAVGPRRPYLSPRLGSPPAGPRCSSIPDLASLASASRPRRACCCSRWVCATCRSHALARVGTRLVPVRPKARSRSAIYSDARDHAAGGGARAAPTCFAAMGSHCYARGPDWTAAGCSLNRMCPERVQGLL